MLTIINIFAITTLNLYCNNTVDNTDLRVIKEISISYDLNKEWKFEIYCTEIIKYDTSMCNDMFIGITFDDNKISMMRLNGDLTSPRENLLLSGDDFGYVASKKCVDISRKHSDIPYVYKFHGKSTKNKDDKCSCSWVSCRPDDMMNCHTYSPYNPPSTCTCVRSLELYDIPCPPETLSVCRNINTKGISITNEICRNGFTRECLSQSSFTPDVQNEKLTFDQIILLISICILLGMIARYCRVPLDDQQSISTTYHIIV